MTAMFQWGTVTGARLGALILVLAAWFAAGPAPAHATRSITPAITDSVWYQGQSAPYTPAYWASKTAASGAKIVLIELDWAAIAGSKPQPGQETNPGNPGYHFSGYLDPVVQALSNAGLQVALLVTDAPQWAEAPGGPANLEADGGWEPDATAFGQFATAVAKRYSGSYPDPLNPGQTLPRVRYFQAWGEANFSIHLSPQWIKSGGSWVANGSTLYRNLLNSFYAGVKSVHSDNFVIATGLGPYGDHQPGPCSSQFIGAGCRTDPALFARQLLCLQGQGLRPVSCANPAQFDALAIDPYQVGGPTNHAATVDDVSVPDLGKLTRILNKASRVGRALPRGHKQLWVTEFGYESSPPNPGAVSLATQARWAEQALYIFWTEGVSTAVWYQIRDPTPTFNQLDYYTGLYFYSGTPKPSTEAFRFPFVVLPSGRKVNAWGISPRSGTLAVQRQRGRSWKTMFSLHATAGGTFVRNVSASLHGSFRAVVGGETSLVWTR